MTESVQTLVLWNFADCFEQTQRFVLIEFAIAQMRIDPCP